MDKIQKGKIKKGMAKTKKKKKDHYLNAEMADLLDWKQILIGRS